MVDSVPSHQPSLWPGTPWRPLFAALSWQFGIPQDGLLDCRSIDQCGGFPKKLHILHKVLERLHILHNVLESAYLYISLSIFWILVPESHSHSKPINRVNLNPQLHPQQCPSESPPAKQLRQGHVILWDFVHPGFFVQNDLQGSQVLSWLCMAV